MLAVTCLEPVSAFSLGCYVSVEKATPRVHIGKYMSFAVNAKQDFKNVDIENFTNDQILKFVVARRS